MKNHVSSSTFYQYLGKPVNEVIHKTTHMAIAAHHDDIEIMALDGILKCYHQENNHFFGVVVSDGKGSARINEYRDYSDEAMMLERKEEQRKAAHLGEYSLLAMLDYPSKIIKDATDKNVATALYHLIKEAKPEVIYTHNLCDKHETHVAVAIRVIEAIRLLPIEERPKNLYGCEVWRDLDWLSDKDKVTFDVSRLPHLSHALVGLFDSQISGGKRYDLATIGRRSANATYSAPLAVDKTSQAINAMDLSPLLRDSSLDPITFIKKHLSTFCEEVTTQINAVSK